jgi:lipoprotein-anchoring transpeptidase ErfK/SrfK
MIFIVGGILILLSFIKIGIQSQKPARIADRQPSSSQSAQELYSKAQELEKSEDKTQAKAVYQDILQNHSDYEEVGAVQKNLEQLNLDLIFSNNEIKGKTVFHEVETGDTLVKIAEQYRTTVDMIKRSNNLQGDVIRVGQRLRVWTGSFNIVVDKSQNVLLLKDDNEVVKVYQVSTGTNNSTPVGNFKIVSKLKDPVWFHKGIVVPPESPENELGSRWMGFDVAGYGIHGTIRPESIGQQVTAGCVRMRNEEVEELFSLVPMGTPVTVDGSSILCSYQFSCFSLLWGPVFLR